jgi:c-di-GMP-binding flagellar brake protein YcgR
VSNQVNSSDSRQYKRWDIFEYALVHVEGEEAAEPAIVVDLSLGGLQARSRRKYPPGSLCTVSITGENDEAIFTQAVIRYSNQLPNSDLFATGFRFVPSNVEERVGLVNYIHTRFQAEADSMAM